MVLPVLAAPVITEMLAALGAGGAGAAGASAAIPAAATAAPTVAAATLPASVNAASPLISTAAPFAEASSAPLDILQGTSFAKPTLEARTAETGSALGDLFSGGKDAADKLGQAEKLLGTPAPAPGQAPQPFSGGPSPVPVNAGFSPASSEGSTDIPSALGVDLSSSLEGIFRNSLGLLGQPQRPL